MRRMSFTAALISASIATATASEAPENCQQHAATLEVTTDKFSHQENRWTLTNRQGEVLYSGSRYSGNGQYRELLCLDDGAYTLTVEDNYGDGFTDGGYRLIVSNRTLAESTDFGYRAKHSFTLGDDQALAARAGE